MLMALMRPSWQLATNNLSGRRVRTLLLITAVALASSLVVAISTCVESVQQTFENQLLKTLGAADARIVHLFQGRFDNTLLKEVESWPEVDTAVGRYSAAVTLVRQDERVDENTGLPLRVTPQAHGIDDNREFDMRPLDLSAGRLPTAPDEILIDSFVARTLEVQPGDTLIVQRFGEPITLNIVGQFDRPALGPLQRPQIYMALPTLEEATERRGSLTDIAMTLNNSVDVDVFVEKYLPTLPEQLSLEPAELARTGFDLRVEATETVFTIAAIFAFLACSFIIIIGMTTGVTERQRELAIVRCLGATKAQVTLSQLLVGLIIGIVGGIIGIPLGVAFASLLLWYFQDLVPSGLTVGWLGVMLAAIGSFSAGLLGAAWPAISASRVSPLRAIAVRAQPPQQKHLFAVFIVAIICIVAQVVLFLPQDAETRFWLYVTLGMPLMQIGYFLLAIPAFIVITRLLGPAISRVFALPADILQQSALAIPFRLGLTAGALMVGIAILVGGWTSTNSMLNDWLGKMTFADGFVFERNGINAEQRQRIAELPFITQTSPIAYLPLRVYNEQVFGVEGLAPANITCIGFNPTEFFEVNRVQWIEGNPETAIPKLKSGNAILVAEEFLTSKGISVGDSLTLGAGRVQHDYEIVGVITAAGLDVATQIFGIRNAYSEHAIRCVFADLSIITQRFDNPDVYVMQTNLASDIDDIEARKQIAEVAPTVMFISGRKIKATINTLGTALQTVQIAVAFSALLLACIAVGNVLIANVMTRQFEYGILRAIGASKGHLIRLILAEALLLALTAATIGTLFGLQAARNDIAFNRDLAGLELTFRMPWTAIAIATGLVIFMTLLAATPAAMRLQKMSPKQLFAVGRGGG